MSTPLRDAPLQDDVAFPSLFRAWIGGGGGFPDATTHWRRFLASPRSSGEPAPAWNAAEWREPWLDELSADQPDEASRRGCAARVAALAAGEAEVVVTGQQPGFLGGPLYTLWKAASAVAAAAARSAAGRPTVALFWFGDDDDDRREAFAPWLWDPLRRAFLRGRPPDGPADRMVGAVPAQEWGRGEAAWLREQASRGGLSAAVSRCWEEGVRDGLPWGRLQRRALLRLFPGGELLAVSGDDARLHAAAAPFYARLWAQREALAEAARARGSALLESGHHAQLGEGSLERPFHLERDGRRLAVPSERLAAAAPPDAALLRPGVLLRSPVQDWLLRPAGVVVGPGELSYLMQLEGVYESLGLARAPLLPRLFARLAPNTAPVERARGVIRREERASPDWESLADPVARAAGAALARVLRESGGLDDERSERLAGREARRWRTEAARLLARAAPRGSSAEEGAATPWAWPFGRPQERTLAVHWATAVWGETLVGLAAVAAREHFQAGGDGRWWAHVLPVPVV